MKKIISSIIITYFIFFMFTTNVTAVENSNATTGHSVQETGQQIANWSINFANDVKNGKYMCSYNDNTSPNSERAQAYSAPIEERWNISI